MELERDYGLVRKRGLGLAAISYDSVAVLKNFADRKKITFPLLSDPDSHIIRAFGILNESVKPETVQYGIPHPGTYILDAKGHVVAKYFEEDMRERVSASAILAGRFGEPVTAARTSAEAKHAADHRRKHPDRDARAPHPAKPGNRSAGTHARLRSGGRRLYSC